MTQRDLSRSLPSRREDIRYTRRRCIVVVLVHASHVANASAALSAPDHVTLLTCLLAGNRQPRRASTFWCESGAAAEGSSDFGALHQLQETTFSRYTTPARRWVAEIFSWVSVAQRIDRTGSPGAVLIVRFAPNSRACTSYASFAGGMGDRALVRRICVPGTDVTSAPLSVRSAPFA